MEDYSLKPIQTIKSTTSPNQFRIKSLSGGYNQPFLISGQQIKTDLENTQRSLSYALTTVDLTQSSEEIVMFLQSELVAIQRQINELDRDQQIRSGIFGFKQGTALTIRKWLQSYKKNQESDLNKQIDFSNLMEQMKVATEKQCIFKLYRIVQALDMIITKQTENIAVLLFSLEDQSFFQTSPALTKISTTKIIPFRLVNALMEKANILLTKSSQQEQGATINIKKELVIQGQLKTIDDLIRFFDKIAINTSVNKEFKTYISLQLSELKKKESVRETILLKTKQESDVAKEQLVTLGLEKKQMKEEIAELNKQKQLFLLQMDELTKNKDASLKELTENYQKQIDILEEEHNKQLEELTTSIQAEMESQVREKVVGLSIRLEEQENEIKRMQSAQIQIQQQQKTSQVIDVKDKQKEEQQSQLKNKERISETINLLEEVKKDYEETIAKLRRENSEFKEKYQDMKAQNENLYQELLNLKQQLAAVQAEKETITTTLSSKYMTKQEFCDTFENALREEFRRMKKSYEDKIEKLNKDVQSLKLEKHRALIDMKSMLDREQETKNLLMKKLSLFIKF